MLVQNYAGRWPFHQARWFCLSASRFRKHRRTSKTILDSYILSKMIVESTTASLTCPPSQPQAQAQQPPWRPPNTFHLAAQDTIRQKLYRSRFLKIFWSIPSAANSPQEMGEIQTNGIRRRHSAEHSRCLTKTVQFLEFPGFELNLNSCIKKDDQILTDSTRDWKDLNQLNKFNETYRLKPRRQAKLYRSWVTDT